ncbi:adenine glycosylase [Corynebacterium aquilae DSM 44791]|uniref:Adenine DNA glycosylase n=1 Tax=Corynebacterium aquilae DSM 44791 TaxID=1431546 RepID=A0A1L7CHZ7_9CORY|nr:adenine glycosylase [Corynebacterium aquilae DSM 44791]
MVEWFDANSRDLPWRAPGTSAYGVLVSEVMSQQTPVSRVAPRWVEWMQTWPTPKDLAQAPTALVLRAWGTLGYPRRALRLQECAQEICQSYGGVVPDDVETLKKLPGIGDYTAAAIASFHYGQAVVAIDTNVRRVAHRALGGRLICPRPAAADRQLVEQFMPAPGDPLGPRLPVALMELGALVCVARTPKCQQCPITQWCAWQRQGCPPPQPEEIADAKRRVQKFAGTDRQCRGRIMAALREHPTGWRLADVAWPNEQQKLQCAASLLSDGLAEQVDGLWFLAGEAPTD